MEGPVTAASGGEGRPVIKLSGETPPGVSEPQSSAVSGRGLVRGTHGWGLMAGFGRMTFRAGKSYQTGRESARTALFAAADHQNGSR
jgi:hypothetical protein